MLELFKHITYSDTTGDEAAACVDGDKDCRNHQGRHPFHPNAARRVGMKRTA